MIPLKLPLRIGLILDHPSPHMVALLDALAERSDCVAQVLYCDNLAPGRTWGAPAGKLPHTFLGGITVPGGLRLNPAITRAIARTRVDIWVVNSCYTLPSTLAAAWWLNRHGTPWIYMNEPPRERGPLIATLRAPLISSVLRRAWGVVGMGKRAQMIYARMLNGSKPVGNVPYYIDLSGFIAIPLVKPPSDGEPVHFLCTGRLEKAKGLEVLLRACTMLPPEGWKLSLAGEGTIRTHLEEVFASKWGKERVTFLGNIPYAERATVYRDKHVLVSPSLWDGWGMVILEALAAGLPVVTTDQVSSAHELVREDVNGFVVPSNDAQVLAEKMGYFLRHPERIVPMGASARETVKGYEPLHGAERLVEFLREILATHDSPVRQVTVDAADPSLTWPKLTSTGSPVSRIHRDVRQASKAAICRSSVILRKNPKPFGHRILVYHLVLPEDRKRFEEHLKFYKDHFVMGSVGDVVEAASRNGRNAPYRLAITFDDGFRMLMGTCLEVLEKHGVKACFLVPTAYVQAHIDPELAAAFSLRAHHYSQPLEPLHPTDLKLLTDLGHEVGSHGIYHLGLGMVAEKMAKNLLVDSRAQIGEWTGKTPSTFAYPYGDVKNSAGEPASWVEKAGYAYGLTLQRGRVLPSTSQFLLPREHTEGNWSLYAMRYFLSI